MKALFCNKCHKRIIPPQYLAKMNMQAGGKIKLKCGDPKCTGSATLKTNKTNEDTNTEGANTSSSQ